MYCKPDFRKQRNEQAEATGLRMAATLRFRGFLVVLLAAGFAVSAAALEPSEVMILVNKDVAISSRIARMYQELRGVPKENVLELSLGTSREITREQYLRRIAAPVKDQLEAHETIRCVLTTSGVPYTIAPGSGREDDAAVDNELAAVLQEEPEDWSRWKPNPLYVKMVNQFGVTDPRRLKMIFVARLDGPDLKTIRRMVEDAIATEKEGLQGPVFGDARGLDGITGYAGGDASIRAAIDRLSAAGFAARLDLNEESWTGPPIGASSQAAGAAFYMGWYKLRDFQNIFGAEGLARGAIAWHMASAEAQNLWDDNEKGWCVNLLRRGAAVTLGPVREPYIDAFPSGDVLVERLLAGASIAESYWLSLPHVSWAMVLLGDPLYQPFATHPRPSLVARAYVAEGGNRILEKDETGAMLVMLQAVGPEGSSTPAMSATAAAGMGLAAASGPVTIPALRARQSAIVRVPRVTAGSDPTGMFRLHLSAHEGRTPDSPSRRISIEGRIGFSRLTGGLTPETQMFLSEDASLLISGQLGNSVLIETDTLHYQGITLQKGIALMGAEFSPDGTHIALAFVDPAEKRGGMLITDSRFGNVHRLPTGTQFLRWLGNEEALLRGPNGLIRHNIAGGEDRAVETPEGWAAGLVIAGTDIQILGTQDGKIGYRDGDGPVQEVLKGLKAGRFAAVADDLSLFGGVDESKRLWVQHGLAGTPETIASGVEQVLWGPISRRAVVQGAARQTRVYDGRDRSWTDLGTVLAAEWSKDEQRLLFVQAERQQDNLTAKSISILIGKQIRPLCTFDRIGQIARIAFSADSEKAFIMAGLAGGLDVWMMALPPLAPAERASAATF